MQTLAKRPRPVGTAAGANARPNHATHDPLTEVASRLKGVIKRHNGGLLAFCPSHDDRKGRSLAVSLGREGQVLMHCFAGCSIHEITAAIDLNPSDLFIRPNSKYEPQTRTYFNDWQIINALRHDALIVLIAARTMLTGKTLAESDVSALSSAVIRIHEAANFSRGASHE
ncbi:hypothetical protein [Nitrosomonas oligotropha]|uniref:DNA primase n=1 Tax=Nitrosomonas oligotropha TaxID=42354 RepID=A0A1H8TZV5_9PROT|nr:hypothetical protein [Nitrosomonas oligotropha]SDX38157.1 hypothetical protein SAMN05216300_13224 [Nitrosomonas oligotropha]SEO95948.1 hypothetical protein SAMN05216333_1296 [Nitrosomonas oligotropha]